jgi:ferredoxin
MRKYDIEENEAGMEIPVCIDRESCSACGMCVRICPIRIFKHASDTRIIFHTDRLSLCIKCGQCMAICPSQSINVYGLDYSRDFFAIPKDPVAEMPFLEMIKTPSREKQPKWGSKHKNLPYSRSWWENSLVI